MKDEEISGESSGDGTGYSIKVEHLYRKDTAKKGRKYLFFFSMIDLKTNLYIACGFSTISEMDTFNRALEMLKRLDVNIKSIRLDKYYSSKKVTRKFEWGLSSTFFPRKASLL